MKIIKKKEFGTQKFVCENCDTEFETGKYDIKKSTTELKFNLFKGQEVLPVYSLSSSCPVCSRNVSIEIPTGEPPYWTLNYDW